LESGGNAGSIDDVDTPILAPDLLQSGKKLIAEYNYQ
jgi:hypothetical protein